MRLVPFTSRVRRGGLEDPTGGIAPMRSEVDRMLERLMRDEPAGPFPAGWSPSVDISETENEIVLRAEVPGIDPDQIDITVSGDRLIISGEKSEQHEERDEHYYHCERRFGSFERAIDLPSTADLEKVSADHANGVLTVHVPKHETAKPKRVQIQSKSDGEKRKSVPVGEEKGEDNKGSKQSKG